MIKRRENHGNTESVFFSDSRLWLARLGEYYYYLIPHLLKRNLASRLGVHTNSARNTLVLVQRCGKALTVWKSSLGPRKVIKCIHKGNYMHRKFTASYSLEPCLPLAGDYVFTSIANIHFPNDLLRPLCIHPSTINSRRSLLPTAPTPHRRSRKWSCRPTNL